MGQKQDFLASIGWNVGDTDSVGVGDLCERNAAHGHAIGEHAELFGLGANGAIETHHEVFLSMSNEAANPENLSTMEVEIDVNRSPGAKAFRLEDEISRRVQGVGRKQVPGVAANHQADEAIGIKPGQR